MSRKNVRTILCLASGWVLAVTSKAPADMIQGVVADSVNGMLLDSVTVSAEGVTTVTDAKGAFTLALPGGNAVEFGPGRTKLDVRWHPEDGAFSWGEYSGPLSISVYSLQGKRVARAASENLEGTKFSIADLPQGIYTVAIETQGRVDVFKVGSLRADAHAFALLSRSARFRAKATAGEHVVTFTKNNFDTKAVPVPAGTQNGLAVKLKSPYPLKNILKLFLDPGIPATGPWEEPPTPIKWTRPTTLPPRPGKGPAQHDFIFVGEGYHRINLIIGGKLAWEYDTKNVAELDEIWMLSNGNVLYAHDDFIEEITPRKEVVWHYDAPAGSEIHTCQPIGLDKVLFINQVLPNARVKLYNLTTKTFEIDQAVESLTGTMHIQCRRFRRKPDGNYIAASHVNHKVFELDKDFKAIWNYATTGAAWSGVPLKNGNIIVEDEGEASSTEVNKTTGVVWKLLKSEIKVPDGAVMGGTQTCERLSSGNTVMFLRGGKPENIQAVEVTPAKEVVWMLQDWIDLGDATTAQFLDEPGYPEVPGQTNH